jgi:hypothetical protein
MKSIPDLDHLVGREVAVEVDDGVIVEAKTRRRWGIAVTAGVVLLGFAAWIAFNVFVDESRPVPSFPSLAEKPDPSLQGTVAYTDRNGCVRLVAAAGTPSKEVYCLPTEDMSKAPQVGKEVGPQPVWLPDGRLEVTVFRMDPSQAKGSKTAPELVAGWRKILDVRAGEVEDVPTSELPSTPNLTTEPTVSPDGKRVTVRSDQMTGKVKVVLSDDTGSRTVLTAHGPGKYMYSMRAFWAPSWQWIAADDGRILVITTDDPSTTRVLVDDPGGGRSGGTVPGDAATFAVTADNILTP